MSKKNFWASIQEGYQKTKNYMPDFESMGKVAKECVQKKLSTEKW
jgi:hypothetical protein